MEPKVSIIIPVYNAETTIWRTVESLIYAEEKNIEIILVDDCSKDKSWEQCLRLQDQFENVRCIKNKQNKGVSYTRNQGIEEAKAPYIMFTDSDDWGAKNYISVMLSMALKYKESLPFCGFHYINQIDYNKTDYVWNENKQEKVIKISGIELFDAVDKTLFQFCWNKIFDREIIKKNKIKFDESQNMGEDFSFVLDYMKAANINECLIVNEALYYYVRANQSSLMSNFGWTSNAIAYQRIKKLANLCGKDKQNIKECVEKQIQQIKENSVYHIIHTHNCSKEKKLERIKQIVGVKEGDKLYKKYIGIYRKEKIKNVLKGIKNLNKRIKGKVQREKTKLIIKEKKLKLKNNNISVISQNCIGGVFYHDMEMEFFSPTINLFIKEPDFVRFVLNLKKYLQCELEIWWEEEYPVGKIGDVYIYFMHYNSCKEAKEAWKRRKKRINFDKILVLATDRNGFTDQMYEKWKEIPYNKLLFSVNEKFASKDTILYKKYMGQETVPDLIPNREFYRKNVLMKKVNSMR